MKTRPPPLASDLAPSSPDPWRRRIARRLAHLRCALREARRRADRAEAEAAAARSQVDRLTREGRHHIGNALQMASGLLVLQSRQGGALPTPGLERAAERIGVLAQVHRSLGHSPTGTIDFAGCLDALCGCLCGEAGRPEGIRIDAAPLQLAADQAVPLAQLAHELVGNALRHARQPITVVLAGDGGQTALRVRDGGPGLPEGITSAAGGRLGLEIVRALTRQLGGSFELARLPGGGTEARILVPPPAGLSPAPASRRA
jgi:two-component sensor histidine kinase